METTEPRHAVLTCRQQVDDLVAILFTFARISASDLPKCAHMPLSMSVFLQGSIRSESGFKNAFMETLSKRNGLLTAFNILSQLLLGRSFSTEYVKTAVLVSAGGWSIFFDSVTILDPGDISRDSVFVVCGVPARRGLRRNRILDGPTSGFEKVGFGELDLTSGFLVDLMSTSRAQQGLTLVEVHADAFQLTPIFKRESSLACSEDKRQFRLGFRKLQENCLRFDRFSPCNCDQAQSKLLKQVQTQKKTKLSDSCFYKPLRLSECSIGVSCMVFGIYNHGHDEVVHETTPFIGDGIKVASFYAAQEPETRWLQLNYLCAKFPRDVRLALRTRDTCIHCAVKMVVEQNKERTWLLL